MKKEQSKIYIPSVLLIIGLIVCFFSIFSFTPVQEDTDITLLAVQNQSNMISRLDRKINDYRETTEMHRQTLLVHEELLNLLHVNAELVSSNLHVITQNVQSFDLRLANLEERIDSLEDKDREHEAAMTGAAKQIIHLDGTLQGWGRRHGILERIIIKHVGEDEWKDIIKELNAEIQAKK